MTGAGWGGADGVGVGEARVDEAAAGFGAGAGAICRGIGGVGADGAKPFFVRSSRSNSLIDRPPAGFAPAAPCEPDAVGMDIVFGAANEEAADIGVCCGFGTPEVIVPSLTTGCCDVAFDHPAAFDGLGGCDGCGAGAIGAGCVIGFGAGLGSGVGAAMSRFDAVGAGGVPVANFGVAEKVSAMIFGPEAEEVAAEEIIFGSSTFSSSGTGAYALVRSFRSAEKIFASIDFEISVATCAGRLSCSWISCEISSGWMNPSKTRPTIFMTKLNFTSSR